MVVLGAVLSIVTVRLAESSVFPAASIARATIWYVPSAGCELQVTEYAGPVELDPINSEGAHDEPAQ
jgi:hypothetical protein